jgi:hypothetical protein
MRRVLAAGTDVAAVAILSYLGFRIGLWATPCSGGASNCFPLAPDIVISSGILVAAYFLPALWAWDASAGQKLWRVEHMQIYDDALD